MFSVASGDRLKIRTGITPSTERSYKLAISHLSDDFGKQLLCDISGEDLAAYRRGASATASTIERLISN
jgi:hypothetical protein